MIAADSFMYFPEDILAFLKSNALHEYAGGGAFVHLVANKDKKPLLRLMMRAASALLASTCGGSLNSLMKSMNCVHQSSSIIITSLTVAEASASVVC